MQKKVKSIFVCSQCGYESPKWCGRCPDCGEWNTMTEEVREPEPINKTGKDRKTPPASAAKPLSELSVEPETRYLTGTKELDRVLGGGIVKGSMVLICGDPGIGKSTLLLQIGGALGVDRKVLYVTGEESVRQIKIRAKRLNVSCSNLYLVSETDIDTVSATIDAEKPAIAIIDSIQTMYDRNMSSSPGSVSQVRECTRRLITTAKASDIAMFMVGHVNKEGAVAGPKVLEHIVDTVLYFEGDRNLSYRILRAVKNRYGSTNEIGVFEMEDDGLKEVTNPSASLLSGRPVNVSGTCVACIMEGSRPLLAEVQALVSASGFGTPRRMSTGFDYNRMSVILAVLEKRGGFYFSNIDAYVNVVGGLRLSEPAADLPVALSLCSSLKDKPIGSDIAAFGEVGLGGEIRAVSRAKSRVAEATRLGFRRIFIPSRNLSAFGNDYNAGGASLIGVKNVREAFNAVIG